MFMETAKNITKMYTFVITDSLRVHVYCLLGIRRKKKFVSVVNS